MATQANQTHQTHRRASNVRWKSVALPTEHGGWGFIYEPALLGLLLAASWGALALVIAAFGAFLLRQPLKLLLKDMRSGRTVPRTVLARKFVLIYGSVTVISGGLMLLLLNSWQPLVPLLIAAPLVFVQLYFDRQNQSRNVTAELAGAMATGAVAASIVLMAGWDWIAAFALWGALGIKAITAVLYVRTRLRLERDKPANRPLTLALHGVGLVLIAGAVVAVWLPWTALLAMSILTARAALGLSPLRKTRPPKIIGMQELAYGLIFVLLIAAGYAW